MSKPIKDWTLGELRGLCKALREINCMGCLLKGKICCRLKNTAPCEWDLAEKPILSIEEARIAEDIEAVFPDAEELSEETECVFRLLSELWEAVKADKATSTEELKQAAIRAACEAVQVAAMAEKFEGVGAK